MKSVENYSKVLPLKNDAFEEDVNIWKLYTVYIDLEWFQDAWKDICTARPEHYSADEYYYEVKKPSLTDTP